MSTKTFTSRSTKQEILKAYNELAKELKQLSKSSGGAAAASETVSSAEDPEDTPVTTGQASIETIIRDLTGIRARLGESVGGLQQQLLSEATRLQALHEEIDEHTAHLRQLHGIEVGEDTLRELVRRYIDTQKQGDETYAQRKQAVEAEHEAKKAAWKKEQEEHARVAKEDEDAQFKSRKREADEYGYETDRRHKADADALAQTKKQQQAELDALKEQHDRAWAEREKELAAREKEYADLRARAGAFPKDLEAAIAKAEAEGTGIAKRQAKIASDLQQKENDGKRRVYELKIHALDETIAKQNEQIAELSKQLATALKQAQDLAIKAIDGASNSSSFAAVKEIALEQAKTTQKTK
jgi:chromosome segregation ATPase